MKREFEVVEEQRHLVRYVVLADDEDEAERIVLRRNSGDYDGLLATSTRVLTIEPANLKDVTNGQV